VTFRSPRPTSARRSERVAENATPRDAASRELASAASSAMLARTFAT
jgi:hypothetical protein